jgi:hypothetical protein
VLPNDLFPVIAKCVLMQQSGISNGKYRKCYFLHIKVGDVENGKKRRKAEGRDNYYATHFKKRKNPKGKVIQTFTWHQMSRL